MKQLTYSFQTTVEFSRPVVDHSFVLRCLPATRDDQEVWARVDLDPAVPASLQRDSFGNILIVGFIGPEHDHFSYRSTGTAVVGGSLGHLPSSIASFEPGDLHTGLVPENPRVKNTSGGGAHPLLLFPSPLADVDAALEDFASELSLEPGGAAALDAQEQRDRCEELMRAIHATLAYEPGSTTVNTTATEAFAQKRGVCQDFTHIMIALLRRWGVPARYASGFAVGSGTTHAWAQAYLGGEWVGFDPTRNRATGSDYLVCAVGRDWTDCPIERGTFHNFADQTQTVFVQMEER